MTVGARGVVWPPVRRLRAEGGAVIPKRRPRARVRKLRGRGRPEERRPPQDLGGMLEERAEELPGRGRVIPGGARERSARARRPDEPPPKPLLLSSGVVVAFRGQSCDVLPEGGGEPVRCWLRGRLETVDTGDRALLAVGDRVEFSPASGGEGTLERILPRRSMLVRGDRRVKRFKHVIASNIDRVVLIASVREPRFRPGLVDRFLVAAASQEIPAALCINKIDLMDSAAVRDEIELYRRLYSSLSLPVVLTSAPARVGLEEFAGLLREGLAVLVGHSGVGKSTLLNALDPGLRLPARPVNRKTGKGTHATSVARIMRLSGGYDVVDTPGVRELDVMNVEPETLEAYFPEFVPHLPDCRMPDCTHTAEPDCAVKAAVESGGIHPRRYESYVTILKELRKAARPER